MSRRLALLDLVVVALIVSCTPTVSRPEVPRPTPMAAPATSTTVTTTTTPTGEGGATVSCPTTFCLVYHINRSANWSDGEPVSANDFAHTAALLADQPGYTEIERVDVLNQKTARVVFITPYGPWQTLFDRVLRDGQTGDDIGEVDTTGPFAFVDWLEGESLTLQRKPDWWSQTDPLSGDPLGDVRQIRFVFMDSAEEMVESLVADEVDVISARPDTQIVADLTEMPDVDMKVVPGPFWEHIDFHHDDPILSLPWAREAVTLAIDREEILDRTVRLIDPAAGTLDNTVWMGGTVNYEPHFEHEHDPVRAEEIIVDHGCLPGSDGVYVCPQGRMSFVWASTNDDPARLEIFESVRDDLAEVGIEIVADLRSPSAFVTRDFLLGGSEVWQMVNFSWRARSDPSAANPTYYCTDSGSLNVNGYCSEQVERLVRETDRTIDPTRRATLYNRADNLYLDDLAVIPLYQKPTLMAWGIEVQGPEPNYTVSGDLWNVVSWMGKSSIVVAIPAEPLQIDPRSKTDDNANLIMGPLLYGAFGTTPTHERQPVLVESVDVLTGDG